MRNFKLPMGNSRNLRSAENWLLQLTPV